MEKRDISIIISGVFFILFLLFVLFRPDLNLERISGKIIGENVLPADKLVLRYDFEEGSGNTVNDLTGKGHAGAIMGAIQFVSGRLGGSGDYSLYFPGGSNYLTIQDADDIKGGQDISVSTWVRVDGPMPSLVYKGDTNGNKIDYNLSYGLISATQKGFGCEIRNGVLKTTVVSDPITDETKWYHVVCVLDKTGVNLKLYVNGVPKTIAVNDALTFSLTTSPMYIGVDSKGRLDSFRIYNKALSNTEVTDLYTKSIPIIGPGPTDGLIAFWPLNDGSGIKAGELINGWNGDITGATWTTDTKPGASSPESILQFDGINDLVEVNYNSALNPSIFSISLWVKSNGNDFLDHHIYSVQSVPNYGQGFMIIQSDGFRWEFWIADGTAAKSNYVIAYGGGITANKWTHLAATYDGSTIKIYTDGELKGATSTKTNLNLVPNTDRPLRIGATSVGATPTNFFNGAVSDVRIYNRILSDNEIKSFNPNYVPPPKFPYGNLDLTNSLSNISDNLNNGIKGNISFVLSGAGKQIDNNSYASLSVSKTGFENSKLVYIDQIMKTLNIKGTNYTDANYDFGGYSSAVGYPVGTYFIDSSIFGLNSFSSSGNYNLSLTFAVSNGSRYSKSKIVSLLNAAPALKSVIPNLTWAKNSNYFIDLSNYFSDPNNDNLTYSSVGTSGSIVIGIVGSKVNFTQPLNYVGSFPVRFRANDFYNATESNLVVLNVSDSFIGNASCIPAWQSSNWSECSIDGLQIRTVVDVNNCNVDTGRLADNQSCIYAPVGGSGGDVSTQGESTAGAKQSLKEKPTKKTESSIFSSKLFLSGLILFIFAGVIVGVYFIRKQRMGVEEVVDKPKFKEKGVSVEKAEAQKFKPVYEEAENVKEMKEYINNALNQGADMNSIKENLIKAGWNKDDVNNTANFITIEKFAKSRINTMSKDQIKDLLISKGWNKELVEKVLAGL